MGRYIRLSTKNTVLDLNLSFVKYFSAEGKLLERSSRMGKFESNENARHNDKLSHKSKFFGFDAVFGKLRFYKARWTRVRKQQTAESGCDFPDIFSTKIHTQNNFNQFDIKNTHI